MSGCVGPRPDRFSGSLLPNGRTPDHTGYVDEGVPRGEVRLQLSVAFGHRSNRSGEREGGDLGQEGGGRKT